MEMGHRAPVTSLGKDNSVNPHQVWMNFACSAVQGTAGSVLDNPAANAIAIADEMLDAFMTLQQRIEQRGSGLVVARHNVPQGDLRGGVG